MRRKSGADIRGWLVSLYDIGKVKERVAIPAWVDIAAGHVLREILGEKLYGKIVEIKEEIK